MKSGDRFALSRFPLLLLEVSLSRSLLRTLKTIQTNDFRESSDILIGLTARSLPHLLLSLHCFRFPRLPYSLKSGLVCSVACFVVRLSASSTPLSLKHRPMDYELRSPLSLCFRSAFADASLISP